MFQYPQNVCSTVAPCTVSLCFHSVFAFPMLQICMRVTERQTEWFLNDTSAQLGYTETFTLGVLSTGQKTD